MERPTARDSHRARWLQTLILLGSTVLGAGLAGGIYFATRLALRFPGVREWFTGMGTAVSGWDALILPVLALFAVAAHEVGHLAGGASQGMRFLLLIIGPFQWHATSCGTRFKWVTHLGLMGGIAAMVPEGVGPRLRRQLATMIASGPGASLLLGMFAAFAASQMEGRLAAYATGTAILSTGLFVITALPFRAAGFMSDGLQLLDLWRGQDAVPERALLLEISAQSLAGTRPRDWNPSSIAALGRLDSREPVRRIAATQLRLYHAMDRQDAVARERLRELLEQQVGDQADGFRQSALVELAICAGLRGDIRAARTHLSLAKGGVVDESRRLLAQTSLARLEGADEQVKRLRQETLRRLPGAMDPGLSELTRDQLGQLTD